MNTIRVIVTSANLRAGPGTNFRIIGGATFGSTATVIGRNAAGNWWQISTNLVIGGIAWIAAWIVSFTGDATTVPITDGSVATATPTPSPTSGATATPTTPTPTKPPTATATPSPTPQPPTGKVIYFTFDDGPASTYTTQILNLLAQYNAKATFFCIGQNADTFPALLDATFAAGHVIANHTYTHPFLTSLSKAGVQSEISRAEQAYRGKGVKILRPPYGATNSFVRAYAAELGYRTVLWDIDTRDWSRPGVQSIISSVLNFAFSGAVVLFHDGGGERSQTVAAVSTLLPELKRQGYQFVSMVP